MPTWQTNVVAAAAVGGPQGSLDPTDPESRYKLVVDIQQQLKRVGCYWGRVNGSWNNNTREAMRSFTTHDQRRAARRETRLLLLSLLKSHNGRSCGAPETTTVAAPPRGKAMSLPPPRRKCCRGRPRRGSSRATRLYTPLPNSVVTTEPLPGRMAIGGPRGVPAGRAGAAHPRHHEPGSPASLPLRSSPAAPRRPDVGASAARRCTQAPRRPRRSARRSGPGTPRYNLMLSLGGVY